MTVLEAAATRLQESDLTGSVVFSGFATFVNHA